MDYWKWLIVVSLPFVVLERVMPRRPGQRLLRKGLLTDLLYFAVNGHYVGVLLAMAAAPAFAAFEAWLSTHGWHDAVFAGAARGWPLWAQFAVALIVTDFIQWLVHNALHRVPWLWELHKVHHSIVDMDFWGSLRFHWMEVVIYRAVQYLPLVWFGFDGDVMLALAVVSTVIGHMNHANVRVSFGPLAYVLNSPAMHLWHHTHPDAGPINRNFGINLAIWDWLFGTAYLPGRDPERLAFEGVEQFPSTLPGQEAWPIPAERLLRRRGR
jgi:sterol desaturase/sphingolipid hydroxylase (fatty acid hydroxylase superfamily)